MPSTQGKDFAHAKDVKAKSTQNTLSNIYKNVRNRID